MSQSTLENRLPVIESNCTEEAALDFDGEQIIYKFRESFDMSHEAALDIFTETKRWLWLCAIEISEIRDGVKKGSVVKIPVKSSLIIIDEMWHTFILFTRDYTKYCHDKFGFFINHYPFTHEQYD